MRIIHSGIPAKSDDSAMVKVEICINSESPAGVRKSVSAAYDGGASSVELCSAMHLDGLTPEKEQIIEARSAFHESNGLMVMIRPREGAFFYTDEELLLMHRSIETAAVGGADGVAFGVLQKDGSAIATSPLVRLIRHARSSGLSITFHRAFDALSDPVQGLDVLIDFGVNRVLTSGTPWNKRGTALQGVGRLSTLVERSAGKIEIVVSGGINSSNAAAILRRLPLGMNNVWVHAYSGAQENGITTTGAVKSIVDAVSSS